MTNWIVIETTSRWGESVVIDYEVCDSDLHVDQMLDEDYEDLCEWEGGPTAENLCKKLTQDYGTHVSVSAYIPPWKGDYVICRDRDGRPFGAGETFAEALCDTYGWRHEDKFHPGAQEVLRLLENSEFHLLVGGELVHELPAFNEFEFLWDNLEEEDQHFSFIVAQNSNFTVFGLGNTMNEAIMDAAAWSAVDQNHPDLREILELLEKDEFSIYHKPEGLMRCPNLPTLQALEDLK